MPEKGRKTLQVKEEYAQRLQAIYEKRKHELLDRDIRTFNGYVRDMVDQWLKLDDQVQRLRLEHGDELRRRGIVTLPALFKEAIRLLLDKREKTPPFHTSRRAK